MKKKKYVIKKKYKEIPPSEILRFGNEFVDEFFLNKDAKEIPINALRVIFNIVSTIRNEQFQEQKQLQQLKLFENEFASEHNSYAEMRIKNSLITTNSKVLKNTYDFLELFKRGWYSFTTSDGRKIKALGGLISNVFYEENGYTSFLINSYWVKKLIQIPEYNSTLYRLVYNVRSNKHILFWFWLSKIIDDGTKVSRSNLNQMFGINYKDSKSLCKDFLKPIRENLNKYSHKSFNYSIDGELIHIKPYDIQNIEETEFSWEVREKVKNNYKVRYLKKRHKLNDDEIKGIIYIFKNNEKDKLLILQAYKYFVENCRANNKKSTDYVGKYFIEIFQKFIKIEYLKLEIGKKYPDDYPKI